MFCRLSIICLRGMELTYSAILSCTGQADQHAMLYPVQNWDCCSATLGQGENFSLTPGCTYSSPLIWVEQIQTVWDYFSLPRNRSWIWQKCQVPAPPPVPQPPTHSPNPSTTLHQLYRFVHYPLPICHHWKLHCVLHEQAGPDSMLVRSRLEFYSE